MVYTKDEVIEGFELTFDPGDKLNASLYLGVRPDGLTPARIDDAITALRENQLWSDEHPRVVRDDQKQAYKDQLDFVEAFSYDDGSILIARFDHPQYPSDTGRWRALMMFFNSTYSRDR
ncbi:MAG: hypothetical protein AAF434_08570 [Pseudomonadota bacterium]